MMLAMLASLLSYSQYPTTKILGKDTVVIMTVKQGEAINNQFTALNDSVKSLRNQVHLFKGRSIILSENLNELNTNYKVTRTQLDSLQVVHLSNLRLYQQREVIWRKDRRDFSIFSVAAVLLATAVVVLGLK